MIWHDTIVCIFNAMLTILLWHLALGLLFMNHARPLYDLTHTGWIFTNNLYIWIQIANETNLKTIAMLSGLVFCYWILQMKH